MQIRPMLAAQKYRNPGDLWSPAHEEVVKEHIRQDGYLLMQPKIDGMRVMMHEGVARSRSWTPWTNRYLQAWAKDQADLIQGWDMELIPGHQHDPNIFREAMSGIRSEDGSRDFTAYLFDNFDPSWQNYNYIDRYNSLFGDVRLHGDWIPTSDYNVKVFIVPNTEVRSLEEIYAKEAEFIAAGWEGAMIKRWRGPYKYGRATAREGYNTKLKRFETDEAEIIGYEPEYHNANEATQSELGYTKRSSHQENLVPLESLGSWRCRLLKNPAVEFSIGVFRNVDDDLKKRWWQMRDEMLGQIVEFEHQGYGGGYDKPRTPVFIRFRSKQDIS